MTNRAVDGYVAIWVTVLIGLALLFVRIAWWRGFVFVFGEVCGGSGVARFTYFGGCKTTIAILDI
jgi:hypothetical protein